MQAGKQRVVGSQPGALHRQGLLDLGDQLPLLEHLGRTLGDLRAGLQVILVGKTDGRTGMGFDPHLMTERRQLGHRLWRGPTRYSWFLISLGMPIRITISNHCEPTV